MGEGQLAFVRFSVGLFGVSPLVGVMFVHGGRIAVAGRALSRSLFRRWLRGGPAAATSPRAGPPVPVAGEAGDAP